jgi:hypothetical protein
VFDPAIHEEERRMAAQRRQQPVTVARVWVRSNIITTVLGIFIVLSLLLHVLTIGALLRVRGIMSRQLETSSTQLGELRQQKIQYAFDVDQTFPVDTTVTISDTVAVPINIIVPIRETIPLPVETPLGTYTFNVPLDFTVPVSDTVQVPINKQVPIKADIPVQLDIPIELELNQPPISDVLQQFEDALRELREGL